MMAKFRCENPPVTFRMLMRCVLFAAALGFAGCASVDLDLPKELSTALTDTGDTALGRRYEGRADEHPGESGFIPIVDGIEALSARLLMADMAERSIDVQYYLITNDIIGQVFVGTLLKAADRGVRVRLLLDDIQPRVMIPGWPRSIRTRISRSGCSIRLCIAPGVSWTGLQTFLGSTGGCTTSPSQPTTR